MTARTIDEKELSIMVMSEASFATEVPSPIDRPTWAAFRAGASLVPSPVGLKCLDKPFLVERTCSGNDFQVFDASAKLVVGHGGYFGTCSDLAAGVGGVVP